jgi:predicted dehydrogenase
MAAAVITPGWVAGEHIRALVENEHTHVAVIVAFSDAQKKRADEYCKKYGFECRITDNLGDALAMKEVEIATVCSINCFHYEHTLAALSAGKHTFTEKPLAMKPAEVETLAVTATENKLVTMAGHIVRYFPAVASLKALVERGDIGEVYHVEADYWHQLTPGWKTKSETAGSAMIMGGIHALDLVRHMIGEELRVESVSAIQSGPHRRQDFDYPPNVSALIAFEGGKTARVGVSVEAAMPYTFHLQVNGTDGAIRQKKFHAPKLAPDESGFVEVSGGFPDDWNVACHPFKDEIDDFIDCVRAGRPNQLDFSRARATYDLLFDIERAAATGTVVKPRCGRGDLCMPY